MILEFKFGQSVLVETGPAATAVECRYWFTMRNPHRCVIVAFFSRSNWNIYVVNVQRVVQNPAPGTYIMPTQCRQKRWGLDWVHEWQRDYRIEQGKRTNVNV